MLSDIVERFRYRYQLWQRERYEDLFGIPRGDLPTLDEDVSERSPSSGDTATDDVVLPGPVQRDSSRSDLWLAALLFALGLFVLLGAYSADVHHTIMRAKHGAIMDPWQGYLAAFLCFGLAAYVISKVMFSKPDV